MGSFQDSSTEFPDCVAALRRGELSLDQMAPIVRHAPGWADTQLSGLATRLTVAQISKVAREFPWDADEWGRPFGAVDAACDDEPGAAEPTVHRSPDSTQRRVRR